MTETTLQASIQTLVDAILAGGAAYLQQVSQETQTLVTTVETDIEVGASNGVSIIESTYATLVAEFPAISSALPNAAALAGVVQGAGIVTGLVYAAGQIASSSNPQAEGFKQATLVSSQIILTEGLTAALSVIAAPAVAAASAAVITGVLVYELSQNWNSIVGSVQEGLAEGLSAANAAQQAANDSLTSILGALNQSGNAALTALGNSPSSGNFLALLESQGYYIVQPSDLANGSTAADVAATIASELDANNLSLNLSGATLQAINAPFSDSSFAVGGLVYIPTSAQSLQTFGTTSLPTLLNGETYVLDISDPLTNPVVYSVGASLDGSSTGALIVDEPDGTSGFPTFASGTFSGISLGSNGSLSVQLTDAAGLVLGSYNLNASLTLPDDTAINLPSESNIDLTDSLGASATPEQVLLSYLSQLGDTTTASALNTLNELDQEWGETFTQNFTNGTTATFDQESYSSSSFNSTTNTLTVDLAAADGETVATLALSGSTGAGTLTLSDGYTIDIPGGASVTLDAPTAGATPLQTISAYLSELGVSMTPDDISAGDYSYQHPTPTETYDVPADVGYYSAGILVSSSFEPVSFNQEFSFLDPGAVITGLSTVDVENSQNEIVPVPAYNILDVSGSNATPDYLNGGDLTQDTITNIQELVVDGVSATLTQAEYNEFQTIVPAGFPITLNFADGGTYSLNDSQFSVNGDFFNLAAQSDDGTTLIGSNTQEGETLTASAYGTDTLEAGSASFTLLQAGGGNDTLTGGTGANDMLSAGTGVDTMQGGASNTVFVVGTTAQEEWSLDTYINADAGVPAAGSVIEGTGTGNLLIAEGDISQIAISGIQTLQTDDITLTADQFSEFSAIQLSSSSSSGAITASTSGTYDLADETAQAFNMTAEDWGGTILIGNDADGETLTASLFGNDTLQAGNGSNDVLQGGDGDDTLTVGSGNNDTLYAGNGNSTLTGGSGSATFYNGDGIDTMQGGSGTNTFILSDPADGTSITGGSGSNTLEVSGDITGISISGIQTLQTSDVTLTAAQFGGFSSITGSGTIDAATGGTYNLGAVSTAAFDMEADSNDGTTLIGNDANNEILTASASGNDTLQAGNGNGDELDAQGSSGNDTLQAGSGTGDVLDASSSTGNDALIAGGGTDTLYAGTGIDTLEGGSGNVTFVLGSDIPGISGSAPATGTTITGGSGTSLLEADGDLTGYSISGVQTLQTSDVTLTADEFSGFQSIQNSFGFGTITAATGGTYDLAAESTNDFNMVAESNDGTTLIGNDVAGETLTASASGNDTLQAGNGTGDVLDADLSTGNVTMIGGNGGDTFYAGSGVTTIEGGTGNDTIEAFDGLTAGSSITEGGGADVLEANGDISGATISGVQTLELEGSVTLTGAEFNNFSSITTSSGFGELNITTAGTYSLMGVSTDSVDMTALSNGGTTLIGNDADFESLTASASGNDTLEAGNGDFDTLFGGGGNDTLTTGTGTGDTVYLGFGSTDSVNASNAFVEMRGGAQATVNGSGNTITFDGGPDESVTFSGTNTIDTGSFSESLTDATVSSNGSGDITITTPLGGFGSSSLTLYADGTAAFAVGSDNITFAANALTSESYDSGAGAFTFGVTSAAPDYSESVTWNPATGKAILNITDSSNNTFQSSLGYINPGDTLEVNGSLSALYDPSGQELNATQVNSDGSQDDISYNTSGSGSWLAEIYAYNAAGTLTSIGWDNDDGSSYTSYYDANGTLQANISVNADTSGYIATNNNQEVTFAAGDAVSGVTVDTAGDVDATITPSGGSAETLALTASGVTATIGGNTLSDTLSGTNVSIDGSGNMTLTAPLGGFGSSSIVLGANGTDTFSVGSDSISLAASSVTSLSYDSGSGAFTFDLNSVASGYSETVSWNPTTGKAILNIGDFATSLGYINPGDTLDVTGSTMTLENSSGQALDAIQVNADGSQNDISYNTSGSGSWVDNIYSYDASGNLTSIRWDNNDGSFVDDFYNPAGTQTGSIIYNADSILHVDDADASSINTAGMATLDVTGYASVTAAQLDGFTSLTNSTGSTDTIYATGAGSYSLATQSISGAFTLDASQTSADVTLTGDDQDGEVLNGGVGADTLIAGTGDTTLNGGSGVTTYEFGSSFGQDTVNNNGGSSASGTIAFTAANDEDLWFQQSGNNLVIDLLGTNDSITVDNWYGSSAGAQVQSFTADGLTLDTQIAQLVQAMATYAANNSSFNPTTATQMPSDANLQAAIAASWHA